MPVKRKDSESSQDEGEEGKGENEVLERQDLYVVFTHERELRNVDQVKIKLSQFTGVVMRCKNITSAAMENLLCAIEADALNFQLGQNTRAQSPQKVRHVSAPTEMGGLAETAPTAYQTPTSGIVNLRFEECMFASKAVLLLKSFLSQKQLIETFCIQKVEFQEPVSDFRALMEGLQFSIKIRKVGILGILFDEEPYGKILAHLLNDCRQLKEFDASGSEFFHPKCFFDMCQAFIGEKCRVNILKLKGIHISNLEGKVLQFVLMKNKSLHTFDLSNSKVDSGECLEFFLQKLDKYSNIRYLVLDCIQPDLSSSLEILGEALSENTKLEVLIMRENKLKWVPYASFWDNIKGNTSLQKINVSKTDLSDRVLEKMCTYLISPELRLIDLDLSRNAITDVGLQNLSESLSNNSSIKYLNLSQNIIRDTGLRSLVSYLSLQSCTLIELSLMGNKINNEGIHILSEFIRPNTSLKMLDISKNVYGDSAFTNFAAEMGHHATLTFLDISKSKELNDEGSLIILARQLARNTHLQTLDLTGVRVRKPFLKLYMEPSLKKNITLKYVLGKLTPDIIDEQLNINIQIQTDVEPNYTQQPSRHSQKGTSFDVHLVDPECNSRLDMKDQPQSLFDAAFKFMKEKDVRQIDFSNMNLQDGQLYQIADYLQYVPNLRSMVLNDNCHLTDDGILRLAASLSINNKLAHLSLLNCKALTTESLVQLNKVITEDNMMLCCIEFDEKQYDPQVAKSVKREATLNKAIQENLKPKFFMSSRGYQKKPLSPDTTAADQSNDKQIVSKQPLSEEVAFKDGAPVHKYLTSAIKCWRITMPVIIQIENQQLTDKHVLELCEFLKNKNMILNLNLRRNRITNTGAMAIIDWMLLHDNTLTHLDVSRNRITRAGASAFLTALKKLTRIVDFQISYGNPIPLDISLAIGYEIVANNQIKANQGIENRVANPNSKVTLTQGRYELIDRGPIYMRCAIKSVELLKITHLSLPDNMLGFEEAKMLAAMIKMNPPLKTLNLEINNLDASCAKLLAEALQSNSNLQVLNIAKNKLADLGIFWLLQSLIKSKVQASAAAVALEVEMAAIVVQNNDLETQDMGGAGKTGAGADKEKLQAPKLLYSKSLPASTSQRLSIRIPNHVPPAHSGLPPKPTTTTSPKHPQPQPLQRRKSNNSAKSLMSQPLPININMNQDRLLQQDEQEHMATSEIELCEFGQLRVLNLMENLGTVESYKAVHWLLNLNPHMVLYFDSPMQMKHQQKQQNLLHEQSQRYQRLMQQRSSTAVGLDDSQTNLLAPSSRQVEPHTGSLKPEDNEDPLSQRPQQDHEEMLSILDPDDDDMYNSFSHDHDVIVHQRSACITKIIKLKTSITLKVLKVLQVLCCHKVPLQSKQQRSMQEQLTIKQVLFWRLQDWKQKATVFQTKSGGNDSFFEKQALQTTITAMLVLNQVGLYLFCVVPYVIGADQQQSGLVVTGWVLWMFCFEAVVVLIARQAVGLQICNPYLWIQVYSGLLKKATMLCLGLLGGICACTGQIGGIILGAVALICLALNQYKTLAVLRTVTRTDSYAVLPYTERSQKIAEIYFYQGLLVVFKKITLLPSLQSQMLSQKIAYDLNPDLIKPPAVGLAAKGVEVLRAWYHQNALVRHLGLVDLTVFWVLIISLVCGWTELTTTIEVTIAVLICDSICCVAQLSEGHTNPVSLNADEVFLLALKRNNEIGDRYNTILMREQQPPRHEELNISEGSLFEQNDAVDFGQNQIDNDGKLPKIMSPSENHQHQQQHLSLNFMSIGDNQETINVE